MEERIACRFCGIDITGATVQAGGVVHIGATVAHETCVHPPHAPPSETDQWRALQFNRWAEIVGIV